MPDTERTSVGITKPGLPYPDTMAVISSTVRILSAVSRVFSRPFSATDLTMPW